MKVLSVFRLGLFLFFAVGLFVSNRVAARLQGEDSLLTVEAGCAAAYGLAMASAVLVGMRRWPRRISLMVGALCAVGILWSLMTSIMESATGSFPAGVYFARWLAGIFLLIGIFSLLFEWKIVPLLIEEDLLLPRDRTA